jgi:hypothetical protein
MLRRWTSATTVQDPNDPLRPIHGHESKDIVEGPGLPLVGGQDSTFVFTPRPLDRLARIGEMLARE